MSSHPSSGNSLIEYLKSVDTPTLSNAVELLSVRPRIEGYTPLQIRCLFPDLGRMCGYAVTAHVETVTASEQKDVNVFVRLYEAVAQSPKPAVVVFQEVGCDGDRAAHCGGIMAAIFTRVGAVGLVTDCGVRDLADVKSVNFQCYARGTVASHANFRIVRVGVPVQIAGLVVHAGDILHGDENGLLLLPKNGIDGLPEAVETVRSKERRLLEYVQSSDFTLNQLRNYFPE